MTRLPKKIKALLLGFILLTSSTYSAQTGTVWGSVKNLSALGKSTAYLTAVKKLNIKYKQALPSSKTPHLLNVYEFSCNCNEADLYTALNNVSVISGIEYGPKYEPLVLPDDYTMNFDPMWSLDLINAEGAWNYTHGDPSINVAVSDQNLYPNHEELIGALNYYDASNTASQGHGTAVTCLVAGNTHNSIGMSSIGWDLTVNFYRMNYNEVLAASNAGARVINLSWTSGCQFNQYQQDAINEVYNNGTFIVAAAGNGPTCNGPNTLVYPASYDNVFSVTSIGKNDNHERIIGDPNSTHQHNIAVDLSAPGYDVPITAAPNWYLDGSGTSYASPIVVGTVGLMLSVNPCLSNWEIETYLKQSSVNIDAINPNYAGLIGAGRLNAEGAVALAANSISNTAPCGDPFEGCENSDLSVWAGLCQTTFWGYTDDYAEVNLNGISSGGYGNISSVWTDQDGNVVGTGSATSFLTNASTVGMGDYITSTYTLTNTDEFGCSVSDDVEVTTYNIICSKPNANMNFIPSTNNRKIMVCSKGGFRCVPYNAVANVLAACQNCKLGPCDAIPNCKGFAGKSSTEISFDKPAIKVFPNPSNGIINVVSEDMEIINKIEIYNHMGQLILTKHNEYNFEIDLTSQSTGIYYVKAYMGDQVLSSVVSYF